MHCPTSPTLPDLHRTLDARLIGRCALALVLGTAFRTALAQSFDAQISPPRFTLKAAPGERVRESIRIVNAGNQVGRYVAHTADWSMNEKGEATFNEGAPAPDSCRPWVLLERREFNVSPMVTRSFRFEVEIPKDSAPMECRFAIMIGADPKASKPISLGQISFPVTGQIGVIVYIAVGGAKPQIEILGLRPGQSNGAQVPIAVARNSGNAHGRLEGVLNGKDASGTEYELQVSGLPIMPGQTRQIPILPVTADGRPASIRFPIALRGEIEWEGGRAMVDGTIK